MAKNRKSSKSIAELKKEAQITFNLWIRQRDKGLPCISCGKVKELQAGHFFAVKGFDGLRFDEDNVNGECVHCNCFDESHLIGYSENLEKKLGKTAFENLKKRAKEYKRNIGFKWNREELENIKKQYK